MRKKMEITITNARTAEDVLLCCLRELNASSYKTRNLKEYPDYVALIEYVNDLASEIVRVESWEDEDDV